MENIDKIYFNLINQNDFKSCKKLIKEYAFEKGFIGPIWHWTYSGNIRLLNSIKYLETGKKEYYENEHDLFFSFSLKYSNQGFHFGTKKAALDRKKDMTRSTVNIQIDGSNTPILDIKNMHSRLMNVYIYKHNILDILDLSEWKISDFKDYISLIQNDDMHNLSSRFSYGYKAAADHFNDKKYNFFWPKTNKKLANDILNASSDNDSGNTILEILKANKISAFRYLNGYEHRGSKSYVLFDNRYIKLGDAITLNHNNEIIPLSKRFNMQSSDIREND